MKNKLKKHSKWHSIVIFLKEFSERHSFYFFLLFIFIFILLIGSTFNFIAVSNNNSKMPVYSDFNIISETHFFTIDKNEINEFYLSDIFKIKTGKFYTFFSIGDVIVIISFLFFIFFIVKIGIREIKYCYYKRAQQK